VGIDIPQLWQILCFIFTTYFSNVIDAAVFNEIAKLPLSTSVLLYKNDFMAIYISVTSSACGTTRKEFGVQPESLFIFS
jgi:hypothetical protein